MINPHPKHPVLHEMVETVKLCGIGAAIGLIAAAALDALSIGELIAVGMALAIGGLARVLYDRHHRGAA